MRRRNAGPAEIIFSLNLLYKNDKSTRGAACFWYLVYFGLRPRDDRSRIYLSDISTRFRAFAEFFPHSTLKYSANFQTTFDEYKNRTRSQR